MITQNSVSTVDMTYQSAVVLSYTTPVPSTTPYSPYMAPTPVIVPVQSLPYSTTDAVAPPPTPVTNVSTKCNMCWNKPVNTYFVPCEHSIVCDNCATKLKTCTICYSRIESFKLSETV